MLAKRVVAAASYIDGRMVLFLSWKIFPYLQRYLVAFIENKNGPFRRITAAFLALFAAACPLSTQQGGDEAPVASAREGSWDPGGNQVPITWAVDVFDHRWAYRLDDAGNIWQSRGQANSWRRIDLHADAALRAWSLLPSAVSGASFCAVLRREPAADGEELNVLYCSFDDGQSYGKVKPYINPMGELVWHRWAWLHPGRPGRVYVTMEGSALAGGEPCAADGEQTSLASPMGSIAYTDNFGAHWHHEAPLLWKGGTVLRGEREIFLGTRFLSRFSTVDEQPPGEDAFARCSLDLECTFEVDEAALAAATERERQLEERVRELYASPRLAG